MNFAAVTLAAALAALGTTTLASADDDGPVGVQAVTPVVVPAKTPMAVHLTDTVSSNGSRSGTTFYFVTVDPVVVDGKVVVAAGTTGSGTLILAGHAGYSGHEGDLTLRFDKIATVDGQMLQFNDQRIEINGRNRKVISFLGGFVPFVGLGAGFIRGSEAHIDPTTVIHTVTLRPATTDAVAAKM
jgi:hypothetical protein